MGQWVELINLQTYTKDLKPSNPVSLTKLSSTLKTWTQLISMKCLSQTFPFHRIMTQTEWTSYAAQEYLIGLNQDLFSTWKTTTNTSRYQVTTKVNSSIKNKFMILLKESKTVNLKAARKLNSYLSCLPSLSRRWQNWWHTWTSTFYSHWLLKSINQSTWRTQ